MIFIFFFVYAIVMVVYALKFKAIQILTLNFSSPKTIFNIIIPFRNESENLANLIKSLNELDYPKSKFDIYLVDDFSEDNSKSICLSYIEQYKLENVYILTNQNIVASPKKSAVLTAMQHIEEGYIMTTDADCLLPDKWLIHFDRYIQKYKPDLIAGAVGIITEGDFWSKFQVLDLMSMQVIGLGSFKTCKPLMCSAANLAYEVKALKQLKAFYHHKDHISGDDIFNLEIFQQSGKKVRALVHPDAVVWTKAEESFRALTNQRIRWASKAKYYKNKTLIGIGLLVFTVNMLLVLSLFFVLFSDGFTILFCTIWLTKLIADFIVLSIGQRFFKPGICLKDYLLIMLAYPFVSLYFAIFSFFGKFTWKDRSYRV